MYPLDGQYHKMLWSLQMGKLVKNQVAQGCEFAEPLPWLCVWKQSPFS